MKIILRMNNFNYDITKLVDTNNLERTVEMKQTIDGQFYSGSIYIPNVKADELGELVDLSRAIIRNSLITIEIDSKKFQWRVMADNVVDKLNGTYSHDIALIDRRSELTGFNLPNLSLTQRSFVSTEKVRGLIWGGGFPYFEVSLLDNNIFYPNASPFVSADNKAFSIMEFNKNNVKGYMLTVPSMYTESGGSIPETSYINQGNSDLSMAGFGYSQGSMCISELNNIDQNQYNVCMYPY